MRDRKNTLEKSMHSKIDIDRHTIHIITNYILVIIYGSFQYLHNMKKQVKTEEKFVTAEILNLESQILSQIVF